MAAMRVTGFAILTLAAFLIAGSGAAARCPMAAGLIQPDLALDTSATHHMHDSGGRSILYAKTHPIAPTKAGAQVETPPLSAAQYAAIQADLEVLLGDSKPHWPADFGTYRGLMIRLAWHCSGTYRRSDGRGGCDGGRIRHAPEFLWPDNINLDKALGLLQPLYDKYEGAVSWGDLIILAGNVAISSGGGPVLGFCGGRRDDADGTESLPFGPSAAQKALSPCPVNGLCEEPLGASTIGLIYVNPAGPVDAPGDPAASAKSIRAVFGSMGFNDRETVALVGSGHAFGKCHGACPDGPGPGPDISPDAPYPGVCNVFPEDPRGAGRNTFTSGFEGVWTGTPTQFSNQYFLALLFFDWRLEESPAGAMQFHPYFKGTGERGPPTMMLVSDVAFINDPEYLKLVKEYADDEAALERDFAAAWYRLTTQDMGPVSRCTGPDVPPAKPFQDPLPAASVKGLDKRGLVKIKVAIRRVLQKSKGSGVVAALAYNCASTFRATDYAGGCNGGRIRFPPQIDWPSNAGAREALALLQPVYEAHEDSISFADIIVLAGSVAVEMAGGPSVPFCPGRVDAENGESVHELAPRTYYRDPLTAARDTAQVMGLSASQYVALAARPTAASPTLSTTIFKTLLEHDWQPVLEGDAVLVDPLEGEYRAVGNETVVVPVAQWALLRVPEMRDYVREFAKSEDALAAAFASGWVYLMNADRFDGPAGSVCA